MKRYAYRCLKCHATTESDTRDATPRCTACDTPMVRDYRHTAITYHPTRSRTQGNAHNQ